MTPETTNRETSARMARLIRGGKDLAESFAELEAFAELEGLDTAAILSTAIFAYVQMSDRERAELPTIFDREAERRRRRRTGSARLPALVC